MLDQKSETMSIYAACEETHIGIAKMRDLIKRGVIERVGQGKRGVTTTVTRASIERYKEMYIAVHGQLKRQRIERTTKE